MVDLFPVETVIDAVVYELHWEEQSLPDLESLKLASCSRAHTIRYSVWKINVCTFVIILLTIKPGPQLSRWSNCHIRSKGIYRIFEIESVDKSAMR